MLITDQEQKVRPKSMQNTSRAHHTQFLNTQRSTGGGSTANTNVFISLYEIAKGAKLDYENRPFFDHAATGLPPYCAVATDSESNSR